MESEENECSEKMVYSEERKQAKEKCKQGKSMRVQVHSLNRIFKINGVACPVGG